MSIGAHFVLVGLEEFENEDGIAEEYGIENNYIENNIIYIQTLSDYWRGTRGRKLAQVIRHSM